MGVIGYPIYNDRLGAHQTYKYYFKKMSQEPSIPRRLVAAELPGRVALWFEKSQYFRVLHTIL